MSPFHSIRHKARAATVPFKEQHHHAWKLGLPAELTVGKPSLLPSIVAVGGGKGGVGKSVVSANLATVLAGQNLRVLVIDLDLGCSNIHTHFGTASPRATLADYILHNKMTYRDILLPAPVNGVAFIAGGKNDDWSEYLDHRVVKVKLWETILNAKQEFDVDVVVLDLGAGVHRHTMDFFSLAHMGIVTIVPEPSSIENAYMFLKLALWHLVENLGARLDAKDEVSEILETLGQLDISSLSSSYGEQLDTFSKKYPDLILTIKNVMASHGIGIVVNQSRVISDAEIGPSMEHICRRYFNLPAHSLGYLNYDEAVWKSLRSQRLLVRDFPHSLITKRLGQIAAQLIHHLGIKGTQTR